MSSRSTIECGKDWHLYRECFDDTVCFDRDGPSEVIVLMTWKEWLQKDKE